MVRLLISTGEVSGDLQGSLLIRALRAEAERRGLELELLGGSGQPLRWPLTLLDLLPLLVLQGVPPVESQAA